MNRLNIIENALMLALDELQTMKTSAPKSKQKFDLVKQKYKTLLTLKPHNHEFRN
jgi:hypothetical protein